MNRKQFILQGLDIRHDSGIEIGPLANPVVTKDEGTIYYVDYADAMFLRDRFKDDPKVDVSRIVDIDAVWGNKTLAEAMNGRLVDYIIAAHVIEHVPNLIAWLQELHSVLREDGQVRLVVPDKRYSFDYLRQETRLSDVLNAYVIKTRIPLVHEVLDCCLNQAQIDTAAAWRGEVDPAALKKDFTFDGAMWLARDIIANSTYHDIHCWVFTPHSFAMLCCELAKVDLLKFACHHFVDTQYGQLEFYVALEASQDKDLTVESWARMARTIHQT